MLDKEMDEPGITKIILDPLKRIDLQRFVFDETKKLIAAIEAWDIQALKTLDQAQALIKRAEEDTKNLRNIFAYIAHFGTNEQLQLIRRSLNLLSDVKGNNSQLAEELVLYPSLLLLYTAGVSSLATGSYDGMRTLFNARVKTPVDGSKEILTKVHTYLISNAAQVLDIDTRRHTPMSDHLNELLKADMPAEIIYGEDFDLLFDRLEVIIAMEVASPLIDRPSGPWAPIGRFGWRNKHSDDSILKLIDEEVTQNGDAWEPIVLGMFGGSIEKATGALSYLNDQSGKYF